MLKHCSENPLTLMFRVFNLIIVNKLFESSL